MKKKTKKKQKVSKFFKIFDYRIFGYEFVKITGGLPVVVMFRVKKYYINKKIKKTLNHKPYIIASNHNGYSDILIIAATFWNRRLRFIATKDVFTNKINSFLFNFFGCIKIDKENVSLNTFKKAKDALMRRHCVPIFPEGTIDKKKDIIDYKSGAILMALVSKTPIIPIYVEKRKKWYKRQRVVIGDVFNVNDYITSPIPTMEEINQATIKLHDIEIDLKKKLNEGRK